MGKSVFLLPSPKAAVNRLQTRRLKDQLGNGLALEGPFADRRGGVAELVEHVKSKKALSGHVESIKAALSVLSFQNLPELFKSNSSLEVPFILDTCVSDSFNTRDSAGAIACSKPTEFEGKLVRVADPYELAMLAVSLLRRMDIECYFSVLNVDPQIIPIKRKEALGKVDSPGIIFPNNGQFSIGLMQPPFHLDALSPDQASYMEVLDEEALKAYITFKQCWMGTQILIRDVGTRNPEFPQEYDLRAMDIGHSLFEASMLWRMEEVEWSKESTRLMFGEETVSELKSMREIAEVVANKILCLNCHMNKAANVILCDGAKKAISNIPMRSLEELFTIEELKGYGCITRLKKYLQYAMEIERHNHAPESCEKSTWES
jgi:hypothetical protein